MYDLSILIPARNEEFLRLTVETLLKNIRGNTEIIVGLDGQWSNPPVPDHERVTILYQNTSIGQRAMTNKLCQLSQAKYVMKLDAHCSVDEGFDVKLLADIQPNETVIPMLYNLHAYDWVCKNCGDRKYQGPTVKYKKCDKCGADREREMIWKPRPSRVSMYYRFDKTLHFQYWGSFANRPESKEDIVEIMSCQGSCFMLSRERYWLLNICDEKHGSWGQQGVEVAMKTWLSGGRLVVNKRTWYSHLFRTQGGDFGFPYPISPRDQEKAREYSRSLFGVNGKWEGAIEGRNLDWVLNKFYPVPDWHEEGNDKKLTKGVIYYTDNELDPSLMAKCQSQLKKGMKEKHIVSTSLKPLSFGTNIPVSGKRGALTMAIQILTALEASKADIIYFAEHDVLYHPTHFAFVPTDKNKFYYNTNVWRVRVTDGHALYTNDLQQLSGLVGYRETLITHYQNRVELLQVASTNMNEEEFNQYIRKMGFEPGTHGRNERVDDLKAESFKSDYPNIDLRHDKNLTPSRWRKDQFRNQRYTEGWEEAELSEIPGWQEFTL